LSEAPTLVWLLLTLFAEAGVYVTTIVLGFRETYQGSCFQRIPGEENRAERAVYTVTIIMGFKETFRDFVKFINSFIGNF
jgi:hypothetical protein